MIPFGIFYKYGLSLPVNVYGELIVVAVFGELMGAGLELYLAKPLGSSRLRDRARGTFAKKQRSRRYSPGRYAVHPADDLNHRTNTCPGFRQTAPRVSDKCRYRWPAGRISVYLFPGISGIGTLGSNLSCTKWRRKWEKPSLPCSWLSLSL